MPIFLESALSVLSSYWKIIVPFVLAVVLIGGAYYYGYHRASNEYEASKWQAAYQQEQIQLKASKQELADLKKQKDTIHVVTETQIKEVPKYIPDNRACDVGPDAIRLLNNARNVSP